MSAHEPSEPGPGEWPVWEVQGYGTVTAAAEPPAGPGRREIRPPWVDIRLTFADGARLDVLAVVQDGRIAIEDAQADPPLPLGGFAALAGVIEAPLQTACEAVSGRGHTAQNDRPPANPPRPETPEPNPHGPGARAPQPHEPAVRAPEPFERGVGPSDPPVPEPGVAEPPPAGPLDPERAPGPEGEPAPWSAQHPGPAPAPGFTPALGPAPAPGPGTAPEWHHGPVYDPTSDAGPVPDAVPGLSSAAQPGSAEPAPEQPREASGRHRADTSVPRGAAGRRTVADLYRAAQHDGRDPVLAVMSATGFSRRKALRLIAGARDEGHLAPRHHRR